MPDEKRILEEGKKLIGEFSEALKNLPEIGETHYVVDLKNVTRPDEGGACPPGFRNKFENLAPKWERGHVKVKKRR